MAQIVVAFETSTPRCPVVVGVWGPGGGEFLARDDGDDDAGLVSANLVDRIQAALAAAGAAPGDLGFVACGRGPGTFTGTRVALATAMGLALGRGVPLLTVSTLAVLAASAGVAGTIRACIDARRGEVYTGTFVVNPESGTVASLDAESCGPPGAALTGPFDLAVGSGVDAHAAGADVSARAGVVVTPEGLWLTVKSGLAAGLAADPADARAVYLRKSYAELGLNVSRRKVERSPFLED